LLSIESGGGMRVHRVSSTFAKAVVFFIQLRCGHSEGVEIETFGLLQVVEHVFPLLDPSLKTTRITVENIMSGERKTGLNEVS
jgi:hypothetical protein